jgi:hypothetical protein
MLCSLFGYESLDFYFYVARSAMADGISCLICLTHERVRSLYSFVWEYVVIEFNNSLFSLVY